MLGALRGLAGTEAQLLYDVERPSAARRRSARDSAAAQLADSGAVSVANAPW